MLFYIWLYVVSVFRIYSKHQVYPFLSVLMWQFQICSGHCATVRSLTSTLTLVGAFVRMLEKFMTAGVLAQF